MKTGTTVSYNWGGVGWRIEKNVTGTVTKYGYSRQNLIVERDSSNTVTAKYVYAGGIDNPVKVIKGSDVYYFQQDALGNVTALVDASGDIFESYTYDVFGAPAIKDANGDPLTEASTPFLFTGREYDGETGLYHYRTRAYSPELGRFLQPDSINFEGGDVNLYRYGGNNPINFSAPLGTDWKKWRAEAWSAIKQNWSRITSVVAALFAVAGDSFLDQLEQCPTLNCKKDCDKCCTINSLLAGTAYTAGFGAASGACSAALVAAVPSSIPGFIIAGIVSGSCKIIVTNVFMSAIRQLAASSTECFEKCKTLP